VTTLLTLVRTLFACRPVTTDDERWLSRAVDVHDLERRVVAIDRRRP
jgi:hypothetical protein